MSRPRVHFLCDANTSVGFGHLSRCLKLAAVLRKWCEIRFSGRFSAEAKKRVVDAGHALAERSSRAICENGAVAVVDIMFDREDMDHYDLRRLQSIRRRFSRVILLSSARTVPHDLPVDIVIGHVLARRAVGAAPRAFRLFAGLDYSPVSEEFRRLRGRRSRERADVERVFLGFGASRDVRGLTSVLDACESWGFTGDLDVLLSPFHRRFKARLVRRKTRYGLRIHENVRSVAPLLRNADVAFGTYGNITFEALCLGTPFIAVPVKDFQLAYARQLETQGLLVCLGRDAHLRADDVVSTLRQLTQQKRERFSRNGRRAVDGMGIQRICRVIRGEAIRSGHAIVRGRG